VEQFMTEASPSAHHGPTLRLYLVIGAALAVFTAVSFIVNGQVTAGNLSDMAGLAIILGVAICKATLVGMYFMHLKYDWFRLYFMILPAFILGAMLAFVLLPDMVFAWR
jgi:cytochrome c oxidase subunit 4